MGLPQRAQMDMMDDSMMMGLQVPGTERARQCSAEHASPRPPCRACPCEQKVARSAPFQSFPVLEASFPWHCRPSRSTPCAAAREAAPLANSLWTLPRDERTQSPEAPELRGRGTPPENRRSPPTLRIGPAAIGAAHVPSTNRRTSRPATRAPRDRSDLRDHPHLDKGRACTSCSSTPTRSRPCPTPRKGSRRRILAHRRRISHLPVEVAPLRVRRRITPRINPTIRPARRLFPFRLTRQLDRPSCHCARPLAECHRIVPRNSASRGDRSCRPATRPARVRPVGALHVLPRAANPCIAAARLLRRSL